MLYVVIVTIIMQFYCTLTSLINILYKCNGCVAHLLYIIIYARNNYMSSVLTYS